MVWRGGTDGTSWQPLVRRIDPNTEWGYPWTHATVLWEGTYRSGEFLKGPSGLLDLETELAVAAMNFDAELDYEFLEYGPARESDEEDVGCPA